MSEKEEEKGEAGANTSERVLVSVEERQVDFYGDTIKAALVTVGEQKQPQIYVPLRPICEYLGLDWSAQSRRLRRDAVLNEGTSSVAMTATQVGQRYNVLCLQLELLPGWLFGIDVNRIKEPLRDKVDRYRRECFKVLWQAFQTEALTIADDAGLAVELEETGENALSQREELFQNAIVELVKIRDMGLSIAKLAEQQIELQRQTADNSRRLDEAARVVGRLKRRVDIIETRLSPRGFITAEQAANIATQVRALAEYLTSKGPNRNHYQGIFAELYRRFSVSSYKDVSVEDYPQVLEFLADWKKAADKGSLEPPV